MTPVALEQRSARRFGWTALLAWALGGAGLEMAHGFKLAAYLDDEMTRLLLRLAHAHGVGLAIVILVWSVAGAPLFESHPRGGRGPGVLLRIGATLIPLGFALGVLGHLESDPGVGIVLVPLGAIALLVGLARVARCAWMD